MSVWQRLFNITPTPQRSDALEAAFIEQSKALLGIVAQQQATLDRIVTAQYDRPIERVVHPVSTDTMPEWGMNDQSSSVPSEIESGLAAMTVDSDEEFLAAVGVE